MQNTVYIILLWLLLFLVHTASARNIDNLIPLDDPTTQKSHNEPSCDFLTAPQRSASIIGPTIIYYDSLTVFSIEQNTDPNYVYTWYKDGVEITDTDNVDYTYTFTVTSADDAGIYAVKLEKYDAEGSLTTFNYYEHEAFVHGIDNLGGVYVPNQVMVYFTEGTSAEEMNAIREYMGAILIKSCMCGEYMEVWEFTTYPVKFPCDCIVESSDDCPSECNNVSDILYENDPNEIRKKTRRTHSEIDSADFNYETSSSPTGTGPQVILFPNIINNNSNDRSNNPVKIALIDTGIKEMEGLENYFWTNPLENGQDEDGNCLINDIHGYDFTGESYPSDPDNNNHASYMAGTIINNMSSITTVELMNLKAFNKVGKGDLFDAICAIHYAIDNEADIINMSWSYQGDSTTIQRLALERAQDDDILMIASAGNAGVDIDITENHFYPAAFVHIPNLLTVAASNGNEIVPGSNYGMTMVETAAPGYQVQPWENGPTRSGTSYSAAFASAFAASYLSTHCSATAADILGVLKGVTLPISIDSLAWGGGLEHLFVEDLEIVCSTGEDGSVFVIPKGGILESIPSGYSFLWEDGNEHSEISNLESGTYMVTISDDVGFVLVTNIDVPACSDMCLDNKSINNTMITGFHQVSQTIDSAGKVRSGETVDFWADCIELKEGFEVEIGADFLANPVPCIPLNVQEIEGQ